MRGPEGITGFGQSDSTHRSSQQRTLILASQNNNEISPVIAEDNTGDGDVSAEIVSTTYDEMLEAQIAQARAASGEGELEKVLHSGETWTVK